MQRIATILLPSLSSPGQLLCQFSLALHFFGVCLFMSVLSQSLSLFVSLCHFVINWDISLAHLGLIFVPLSVEHRRSTHLSIFLKWKWVLSQISPSPVLAHLSLILRCSAQRILIILNILSLKTSLFLGNQHSVFLYIHTHSMHDKNKTEMCKQCIKCNN